MENKTLGERSSYQLMSLASRIKAIHHAMTTPGRTCWLAARLPIDNPPTPLP